MSLPFSFEAILAIGHNNAMGLNGELPWNLPSELALFKEYTEGHLLIMGRRTFESLPHILSNRHHIVISRNMSAIEGIDIVPSMDHAIKRASELSVNKVFLIGGVQIFEEAIHECSVIHLSRIMMSPKADTFYAFKPKNHHIVSSRCFRDPSTQTDIIYQRYEKII